VRRMGAFGTQWRKNSRKKTHSPTVHFALLCFLERKSFLKKTAQEYLYNPKEMNPLCSQVKNFSFFLRKVRYDIPVYLRRMDKR
ncbi:hypothetical protein, partial [uncultured Bilophila sp.]|uniref:hypothetical protein n=1 Tax=uncultured Bilophila sp. TaxID=529385 RepID=UPI00280A600B